MSYDEHLITQAGGDRDILEQIQRRAHNATPGPWDYGTGYSADGAKQLTTTDDKADFLALSLNDNEAPLWVIDSGAVIPAVTGDGPNAKANAAFIAHARTDVDTLLALVREQQARLESVRALAAEWESLAGPGTEREKVFGPQKVSVEFAACQIRAALEPTP